MPLVIGPLGKVLLVATAGVGATYAISKSLASSSSTTNSDLSNLMREIRLDRERDYSQLCLIVLQGGEKGQPEKTNKKLLACRAKDEPTSSEFYFYDSSVSLIQSLREVKSIKATENTGEVTLVFYDDLEESSEKETSIQVFNGSWSFLNNVELKKEATINWRDRDQQKKLTYKDTYRNLIRWH